MEEAIYLLFRENVSALDADTQRGLFLAFRQLVYRDVLFLLNDHALSEDVIQESFLKAMKHGRKAKEDSKMKAWLRQVARNTAIDAMRKNKRFRHVFVLSDVAFMEEEACGLASAEPVDAVVETMIRDEMLHRAIAELKAEYRVVLFLYYIAELSYAEICREVGITEQVLTQRLARARKKLAKQFSGKWGDA